MKKFTTVLIALLVPCCLVTAHAAEEQQKDPASSKESIEDMFSTLDRDGDDQVSRREFIGHHVRGARGQGTEEETTRLRRGATARFIAMDSDGDDALTLEEFVSSRERSEDEARGSSADSWFEAIDSDSNDEVSLEEFTNGFKRRLKERAEADPEALEQRLTQRFERMDANSDGVVTRKELAK